CDSEGRRCESAQPPHTQKRAVLPEHQTGISKSVSLRRSCDTRSFRMPRQNNPNFWREIFLSDGNMSRKESCMQLAATIREVIAGNIDAFEAIVLEYGDMVRTFFASHIHDPAAIDDLAQESFITAYEKLDTFDTNGNMSHWLRGIARNKLLRYLREQNQ